MHFIFQWLTQFIRHLFSRCTFTVCRGHSVDNSHFSCMFSEAKQQVDMIIFFNRPWVQSLKCPIRHKKKKNISTRWKPTRSAVKYWTRWVDLSLLSVTRHHWLICHTIMCHITLAAAANLLTSSHPHRAHHLMACYFLFLPPKINRKCAPNGPTLCYDASLHIAIRFRTVRIHMKIQWLSRVLSVVMKLILLNKHRLSWSGTNKL